MNVALHAAGGVDLDRSLRLDVPDHGALDDHLADVHLGLDDRAFTDDEHVIREHFAAKPPVDTNGALERELALESGAASEERRDLPHCRLFRCGSCHDESTLTRSRGEIYVS